MAAPLAADAAIAGGDVAIDVPGGVTVAGGAAVSPGAAGDGRAADGGAGATRAAGLAGAGRGRSSARSSGIDTVTKVAVCRASIAAKGGGVPYRGGCARSRQC